MVDEPDAFVRFLEGERCRALVAQEFWHRGAPADLVNLVFLQVSGGRWARFFFDARGFSWQEAAPQRIDGGAPAFEYRLVDVGRRLGVEEQRIERVEFLQPDRDCARLLIRFERGTLILDSTDDHARLAFVEATPVGTG